MTMEGSNLNDMRAELKAMRQELNDLREMTSTCVPAPPVVVGSPDGSGGAAVDVEAVKFQQQSSLLMEDLRDHTIRVSEKHWVVALEPSCWSIPLIANKKSRAETVILMLLFLTNLALQSVFCFVVYWILGASTGEAKKNIYSERTVQELVEWRRSIAHEANFYKRATLRSMAQRVCDGDAGLESSTSQQERYELLAAYIGGVDEPRWNFGAWMATACLFVFLLSMVKELRGTLHLGLAVAALPAGRRTELSSAEDGDKDGGTISLLRISQARRGIALAALVLRAVRDAVLLWFGCRWLVNTVDLGELLLNAVALEFVTSIDELVFSALAPMRTKARLASIRPLRIEKARRATVVGRVDIWSLGTLIFVFGFVLTIRMTLLGWQLDVLVRARDAICGGDQDFVYTTDGAGIPAWGYPASVDIDGTQDVGFGHLVQDENKRTFATRAIDAVLDQHGRVAACEPEDCYTLPEEADGSGLRYIRAGRPDCCMARLLEVPNVDSGEFSVLRKSTETISEAVASLNPICHDILNFDSHFSMILRGAMGDESNRELWRRKPGACGGACPEERFPMCDEATDACITPVCANFEHSCKTGSTLGVRARQFCPQTCGCDDPLSDLALYQPASGCGEQCARAGPYIERRRALPCTDVSTDDEKFQAAVADILRVAQTWPLAWLETATVFYAALAKNGCDYLGANWTSLTFLVDYGFYPYAFGLNVCTGDGGIWPVHPMSYFCPVACGCRSGDAHCPDACPARSLEPSETCLEHQRRNFFVVPETTEHQLPDQCPMAPGRAAA